VRPLGTATAALVLLLAAAAPAAAHVDVLPREVAQGEAISIAAAASGGDDGSGAAIWLGVIAIGISALAALGVGLLWSTRPARLPEEE
jgi:hypothetical protein